MKLNQVIALLNGVKNDSQKQKTTVYQLAQKNQLFQGLSRTFLPVKDDGYVYPAESASVSQTTQSLIDKFNEAIAELLNIAATQDWGNTEAKADVSIDGKTILPSVPVTHLLFLEKQLNDIEAFITKLPVLPSDRNWHYDPNRGLYKSEPTETTKTKKITEFVVAYEATTEHPADVREVSNDVIEGRWTKIDFSGALPQDDITSMMKRLKSLKKAVISAREEANGLAVQLKKTSEPLLAYIFGDYYNGH